MLIIILGKKRTCCIFLRGKGERHLFIFYLYNNEIMFYFKISSNNKLNILLVPKLVIPLSCIGTIDEDLDMPSCTS